MTKTSIIIPTFNGLPLLSACIDSIRSHTIAEQYELIIVDNGSTDGTAEYCIRERLTFVSLPKNIGFPKACNIGISIATRDQLLLLNNDVICTPNWLSNLTQALTSSPDIGIVGPSSNDVNGLQLVEVSYSNMEEFQQMAALNNSSDPNRWLEVQRVAGLCFLFKREVLNKVGVLDEAFSPRYYEDDDYCFRARIGGYKLLLCQDVLIYHGGSASFKTSYASEDIAAIIDRNYQLFINKWHVDPHQFIDSWTKTTPEGGEVQ
ncbi:glycosyltransferase family 2 protein [Paenibacillus sp. IHBB 10380]|uniref:glycosyltransferase family 2 protein n=1 Tax=Paenibacillus sp. IHBB 10380 TaxID=1566358 RepID=UPI0005CFED39|nr:glycosyltransferase family 2 protein [Paenibacillus sp. IHBB 10380]AJS57453.1 glycosyl transferase family 2 [Paenibacillus sp. IHBB 10380]